MIGTGMASSPRGLAIPTLRAEVIRTRGSAASLLPLLGLVVAGISTAGAFITPQSREQAALYWHTLYVTGMAAGLLALLAGVTTAREAAARQGGTRWRAVNPRLVVLARFLVLAGLSALFHVLAFWAVIPLSLAVGAPIDAGGLLGAGAACWLASLGVLAVAFVASERWGTVPVFLAALGWQVAGTLLAESTWWVFLPPTWAVRAMLPVLGAHQNAEPLATDDPLAHESPAPALALGLGLAVVILAIRLGVRKTVHRRTRTDARPVGRRSTRPGVLGAVNTAMRGRPVLPLCAAALGMCLVTAIMYPAGYILGLHTYALLPLGACVTAVLLWQTLTPGWRLLVVHRATLPTAVQTWLVLCVSVVTLLVFALALADVVLRGSSAGDTTTITEVLRAGVLWLIVGVATALTALWLTVRFGVGWALGAAVVVMTLAATIAGDVLAGTWLWLLGPTAWPLSADTPARFALACALGLLATGVAWALGRRELRAATARGL